jgi:hypothetical protein
LESGSVSLKEVMAGKMVMPTVPTSVVPTVKGEEQGRSVAQKIQGNTVRVRVEDPTGEATRSLAVGVGGGVFLINTHALKPRVMVQVLEVKPSDTGLGGRAHLVEEGITSFQHG